MAPSHEPLLGSPTRKTTILCKALLVTLSLIAIIFVAAIINLQFTATTTLNPSDLCTNSPNPSSCHTIVSNALTATQSPQPGPLLILRTILDSSFAQLGTAIVAATELHRRGNSEPKQQAALADCLLLFRPLPSAHDRASYSKLAQPAISKQTLWWPRTGVGSSKTVQEAVDSAPDRSTRRYVIYVKKGVYKEIVSIGKTKKNVMIVGDGMTATVITGSLNFVDGTTTFNSATVEGENCYLAELEQVFLTGQLKIATHKDKDATGELGEAGSPRLIQSVGTGQRGAVRASGRSPPRRAPSGLQRKELRSGGTRMEEQAEQYQTGGSSVLQRSWPPSPVAPPLPTSHNLCPSPSLQFKQFWRTTKRW
ncbi:hypothetical protein J5N97_011569 [Dioscorea zingiberensis]|uniref:Pectinesterase n=1 Tax=Dioscorea zingiberensis TaxID=325984 RepID=A0A9D5HNM7_9LILI|nr:hypothetical protein J5N97_011569 [Dioscorea zingiberensis]